jgi:hypothetical protein
MSACLVKADDSQDEPPKNALVGTLTSSLHRLKDTDNQDGGFFVFGDLSVKMEGKFKLKFSLWQMKNMEVFLLAHKESQEFEVFAAKSFPGLAESTFLTRSFSDQGVRLRLRKDSRSMTKRKRDVQIPDYGRKHHPTPGRDAPRSMPGGRANGDDGMHPYGQSPGLYDGPQNYAYDDSMVKRQRMGGYRDDGYGHHDMGYAPRSSYGAPIQQLPSTSAGYPMQTVAASPYQPLGRLDTHLSSMPPAPNSISAPYPHQTSAPPPTSHYPSPIPAPSPAVGGGSYHSPVASIPTSAGGQSLPYPSPITSTTNSNGGATFASPQSRQSPHAFSYGESGF